MASERIVGLYEDNAAAWDAQRGRELFERPWLDRFCGLLPPGAQILDLGCGMGEPIAAYFISLGFEVTGVDSSTSLGAEAGEAIGSWQGEPLYHGSLDTAEYRALLEADGFEVLEHVVGDPGCGHATIWLARKLDGGP